MRTPERWVIFGKGGIGKSTICANLSLILALRKFKVLHVGCDPKHDSSVRLTGNVSIPTVLERFDGGRLDITAEDLVHHGRLGIDCIEAGGPKAGVGCAGRGISRMLELVESSGLLRKTRYDVVIFDVLGDVVCGGFAAPLRKGLGQKVFIVASEELSSMYAANNIANAVISYASNGIVLGGLIANTRSGGCGLSALKHFAARLKTRIIGTLPYDPAVRESEFAGKTMVEYAPKSPFTRALVLLSQKMLKVRVSNASLPKPMPEDEFYRWARSNG